MLNQAYCSQDVEDLTFKWSMYKTEDDSEPLAIPDEGTAPGIDNTYQFRTSSLWFADLDEIYIQMEVTRNLKTMVARKVFQVNKPYMITEGSVRQKQSTVRAYNTEAILIPNSKWSTLIGGSLFY